MPMTWPTRSALKLDQISRQVRGRYRPRSCHSPARKRLPADGSERSSMSTTSTPRRHRGAPTSTPSRTHPANLWREKRPSQAFCPALMSSVDWSLLSTSLGDVADHSSVQIPEGVSLVNAVLTCGRTSRLGTPRVLPRDPTLATAHRRRSTPLSTRCYPLGGIGALREPPAYRARVGYSLAGLFSLWAGVSPQGRTRLPAGTAADARRRNFSVSELSRDRSGSHAFWTVDQQLSGG